jgi:hypothetical protein
LRKGRLTPGFRAGSVRFRKASYTQDQNSKINNHNSPMADHSIPIVVDRSSLKGLAGKTVLITGASSGIGLETAELFYELGCNVVFVGGRKRPTTYVDLSSPRVLVLQCNVANWESQVDIFEATIAKFGKIDIVVPNAGVAEPMGQYFNLKGWEEWKARESGYDCI